jgi:lipid-A-disaccharide synthase-like uncharacterized protein
VRAGCRLAVAAAWLLAASSSTAQDPSPIELKLKIPGVRSVELTPTPAAEGGAFRYQIETGEGAQSLSPEEFTDFLYEKHRDRPFWKTFLNITSPIGIAWVALGLLGQLLFAGRMLVQWLTSERRGRSTVPLAFWWMSLAGASMLLVYFIWRKDVVGVLGQSTGWLIYARNLYMIHTRAAIDSDQAAPQPGEA